MELFRKVLRSKIHRATVTHADIHYEGSITVPPALMQAAGLVAYEAVDVWDVTNGSRFETYVIEGRPGSCDIAVNGAAARLVAVGDTIIIACFMFLPQSELASFKPKLVFVDANNRMVQRSFEVPGPQLPQAA